MPDFWPDCFLLATSSAGKADEFATLLAQRGIKSIVKTYRDFDLTAPDETGATFEDNVLIKARAGLDATGLPTLADDSGLCVGALNGAPGVYSADWAEETPGGPRDFGMAMRRIDDELAGRRDRAAYFTCTLALLFPDGTTLTAEGRVTGRLLPADRPMGDAGHGYDPWFVPDGYDLPFAALGMDIKNELSHRARAFHALIELSKG